MAAKAVSVSADGVTFYKLPGNTGELSREGEAVDDSVFGETFRSEFTGLLSWSLTANAVFKGFAGYQTTIKRGGTPVALTDEPMELVSGKTYQITAEAKRVLNRLVTIVVEDSGGDITDEVESIDLLFGRVTFKSTFTPTGSVTLTGSYIPMANLCYLRGFTLTQTTDPIDNTDNCSAQSNGGYTTYDLGGLRTVRFEGQGIYNAASGFFDGLSNREEYLIELSPDGGGKSVARGLFRMSSDRLSGNIGALEEEAVSFSLSVPENNNVWEMGAPFSWVHASDSPIPAAIKVVMDAWQNETGIHVKYLPDGTAGWTGEAVVTNISMTNTMAGMNTFDVSVAGNGALTAVP